MLTLSAPAKINLTLEVLDKREDGFHEIRSVIQTIGLFDTLHFKESNEVKITADIPGWGAEESLVSKTVDLVKKETGCSNGVEIEIEKRIPLSSGLGGDSSDAAAVLQGLNRIWGLDLPPEKLLEFARQLGSDVSIFLYGGTALLEGRGEIVTPLPAVTLRWVVLVVPDVPNLVNKTKQMYQALDASHYTDGRNTRSLVEILKSGRQFESPLLFNAFEYVAFDQFPGLRDTLEHFIKSKAVNIHLAGSGPALFTLYENKKWAERLHSLLKEEGIESYLVETLNNVEREN